MTPRPTTRYLTPSGVAAFLGCPRRTVQEGIDRGALKVASEHEAASGEVVSRGITEAEALRWDRVRQKGMGRPKGS